MKKGKGAYLKDGELQYNQEGSLVFECEYKNCKKPQKEGYIKCEQHINVGYPEFEKARTTKQLLKILGL